MYLFVDMFSYNAQAISLSKKNGLKHLRRKATSYLPLVFQIFIVLIYPSLPCSDEAMSGFVWYNLSFLARFYCPNRYLHVEKNCISKFGV